MTSNERTVLVLYGSETGNAQDMAEELGKMCQRLHFHSDVEELDAVELVRILVKRRTRSVSSNIALQSTLLRYQLVIFVVSTTGQGDMPHNGLLFWKRLLRKKLPPACLAPLRYTVFGLGDSTYLKYALIPFPLTRHMLIRTSCTDSTGLQENSFAAWTSSAPPHSSTASRQTSSFRTGKSHHHSPPWGTRQLTSQQHRRLFRPLGRWPLQTPPGALPSPRRPGSHPRRHHPPTTLDS